MAKENVSLDFRPKKTDETKRWNKWNERKWVNKWKA